MATGRLGGCYDTPDERYTEVRVRIRFPADRPSQFVIASLSIRLELIPRDLASRRVSTVFTAAPLEIVVLTRRCQLGEEPLATERMIVAYVRGS